MEKSPDAFRTISEAADELDLPQHVLRFWETRFSTIKPLKRGGGRRYYRPEDVLLLKGIRHLLYDQGFTIKGVQKILKDQGPRHVAALGNGGAPVALALADDSAEMARDASVDQSVANGVEMAPAPNGGNAPYLEEADRELLGKVLRDMLEMKRLLERARE
ncbi:MAG: MerR family transcriptional regulator [Devosia sp.]